MDGIPATLADPNDPLNIPQMLVVGAVNPTGTEMWLGTNRDAGKGLPHVYAPGTGIKCPDNLLGKDQYRDTSGTSAGKPSPSRPYPGR